MSREIKFRAWDTLRHEWCGIEMSYKDDRHGPKSVPVVFDGQGACVIQQYTGLKDKNGVEIYEGDIIKPEYHDLRLMNDHWVVEYGHTGAFQLAVGSFKELLHNQVHNDWKLEVIGNVHENPELLSSRGGDE